MVTKEEAHLILLKSIASEQNEAKHISLFLDMRGYYNQKTRQEKKERLNELTRKIEAFEMAVKALEQEPKTDVLDKIRAEIEEYRESLPWESNTIEKWSAINHILEQIINKYRESEDKQ